MSAEQFGSPADNAKKCSQSWLEKSARCGPNLTQVHKTTHGLIKTILFDTRLKKKKKQHKENPKT